MMRRFHSIAELLGGRLKPGERRVLALLHAYFDGSFTHSSPERIVCIGGYVGTQEQWLDVEQRWNAQLEAWGLQSFHLSPLLAGRLPPVKRGDAEACALSFANILVGAKLLGMTAGLHENDWLSLDKTPAQSRRFPTAYHACLHMLFEQLEEHVKAEYPADGFEVILDLDKEDKAHAPALRAIFDELRANPRCAGIIHARRSRYPLLECADLCAGLSRKEWADNGFLRKAPKTKLGWASYAANSRGTFWSLEWAKYMDEVITAQAKRRAENAARQG